MDCPQYAIAVVIVWCLVGVSLFALARILTARAETRDMMKAMKIDETEDT